MSLRTVAVVQARMGSSRLPGKVLMPLAGRPLLVFLLERLENSRTLDGVVVATSTEYRDDAIFQVCDDRQVPCFRGSERDVLGRYAEAARFFGADIVVRVTADNPFTDPESIDRVVRHMRETGARYAIEDRLPIGTTGEALTRVLLEHLDRVADEDRWREHVTLYAKERLSEAGGVVLPPPAEVDRPELRLTVDELVDYLWIQDLVRRMPASDWKLPDIIRHAERLTAVV